MNNINRDKKVYNIINEQRDFDYNITNQDIYLNYYNNNQNNFNINIICNDNCNIVINIVSIILNNININVNIDVVGNNNNVNVYYRGIALKENSNINVTIKVEENTFGNVILEDLKGINEDGCMTLLPILEIDTNDISAEHYATIGSIEQDKLFYLMQKGINKEDAYNILKKIFLYSLFDKTFIDLLNKKGV